VDVSIASTSEAEGGGQASGATTGDEDITGLFFDLGGGGGDGGGRSGGGHAEEGAGLSVGLDEGGWEDEDEEEEEGEEMARA